MEGPYMHLGGPYFLHVSPYRGGRVYFTVLKDTRKRHWLSKKVLYEVVYTDRTGDRKLAERKARKWLKKERLIK